MSPHPPLPAGTDPRDVADTAGAGRERPPYASLPATVREAVTEALGSPVVSAVSMPGGFSPGSADRVVTAAGRRAFVKAVGDPIEPTSTPLHRRELAIARHLPAGVAPTLLGGFDDGEWVALVLEDVDGGHPRPVAADVDAVLDALLLLPEAPAALGLPDGAAHLAAMTDGWSRLDGTEPVLSPAAAAHLGELRALAEGSHELAAGTALVHHDLRLDNALLTDDGARIVDWPWAAVGAAWVDGLTLLADARLNGLPDPDAHLAHELFADVAPEAIDRLLAGLAAYFFDASRHPEPPTLPGLREFQRLQGVNNVAWLAARRSW